MTKTGVARRRRLGWMALGLALALSGPPSAGAADPARPNLIVIMVDDLGWGDTGCYGDTFNETPSIDRLCREGMRFTSAYASGPNCSPSRAALLSGRHPASTGVTTALDNAAPRDRKLLEPPQQGLAAGEVTIAEVLREAGYVTAAVGKWHLGAGPEAPSGQGFDVSTGGGRQGRVLSHDHPFGLSAGQQLPGAKPGDYLTDALTSEAIGFVRANRDRPFFLLLAFYAVHVPIQGKPALVEKYRAKAGAEARDPAYAAMLESVDQNVGRILDALDDLAIADRTLVVLTSDNGGMEGLAVLGPFRGGKGSLYEGGLRIPFVARLPGVVRPGTTSGVPIAMTDLFPTLLELASVASTSPLDGQSLVPLLRGSGGLSRDALYWHFPHYLPSGTAPSGAIRAGDWKLIESFETGELELYDLAEDPGEKQNRAAEEPGRVKELRARLAAWRTSSGARMPSPNPDHRPAPAASPS